MPSFEADIVLRALIEGKVTATIGPDYLGSLACAELAAELNVPEYQLWGAICSLRDSGRVEGIRTPERPGQMLIPTHKGERYFQQSARKQPYPRERCRRAAAPRVFASS